MDRWMDACVHYSCVCTCVDGCTHVHVCFMRVCMCVCACMMHVCVHGWMGEWVGGWVVDGHVDGWMDARAHSCMC